MHRHSIDLGGLLFGLAFAIAGASFLVREATDTSIDPAWATGLGLMLLGAVALVVTLARATHHDRREPAPPDPPEFPRTADSDG
jgi:drug/metabolite transporter (DMT)-like permease